MHTGLGLPIQEGKYRFEKRKKAPQGFLLDMAGEEGFEPPLTESESVVLPLDDSPNEKAEAKDSGLLQKAAN